MQNGEALNIQIPAGDPNLIKMMQHYVELAKQGKIIGVCMIAITPEGNVYANPALPQNPSVMQLAMGALTTMIGDIRDMVIRHRHQVPTSPIIKPGNGMMQHHG